VDELRAASPPSNEAGASTAHRGGAAPGGRDRLARRPRRAHLGLELGERAAQEGVDFILQPGFNNAAHALYLSASEVEHLVAVGVDAFVAERYGAPVDHYRRWLAWIKEKGCQCTGTRKNKQRCGSFVQHVDDSFEAMPAFVFGRDDRCPHHRDV
jgi:hypothetical protein